MNRETCYKIIKDTLQSGFDKERFIFFIKNLLNEIEIAPFIYRGNTIPHVFGKHIKSFERVAKYTDGENKIDILIVNLKEKNTIERARTMQRNFIAWYLNGSRGGNQKDAALVAFISPNPDDWRFSLIKMDYKFEEGKNGKVKVKEEFTPARRWSFLVGAKENCHTAQSRLAPLIEDDSLNPNLHQLEEVFNIEKVTKEFFDKYRELFLNLKDNLDRMVVEDSKIKKDFIEKDISTIDFAKKLLGQIVFLYFLQKKGWFGVERDADWGTGHKDFLRQLFEKQHGDYKNFFNDILEHLFYDALARPRDDDYYGRFNCKIPFLNGGLFDPIGNYDWVHTDIILDDEIFSNKNKTKEGDVGNGILDIFDRYNFTVREDEPLEKEVAVDPEMLGKVFENLLEVKDRKSKGTYYTPREIVHYMCEQSLINYLATELPEIDKKDIEEYIKIGDQVLENEYWVALSGESGTKKFKISPTIIANAESIDKKLADIKVCDPAIGSGAFPVGMMNEIVCARIALNPYINKKESRTPYDFKNEAITNSLYGVDIDPGAVEIAKLRLWLSLVVDEEDIHHIKPLPNLDYKIMQGNSLLEEFEGIKLFDENIIPQDKADKEAQIQSANRKISELSREFIKLHSSGKLSKVQEQLLQQQIKGQQKLIEGLERKPKAGHDMDLFKQHDETKRKWDELTELHKDIINETNRDNKKIMLNRASELEWEFVEATLKQESKLDSLRKVEQFKKKNTKPFFLWHLHFADVFQKNSGFDIAIANPPYVRQEEIRYKPELEVEYEVFNSMSDLYTYFYEKGFKLLKNYGVLTFITSNKFMRARYGMILRRHLNVNTTIKEIINFGNQHIFEAITNTLIFVATKQKIENNLFNYSDNINDPDKIVFQQNGLQDREWTIDNPERILLKKKIERLGTLLKNWDVNINYGIKTGYNEAFIIDELTKNELVKKDPKCEEIIKPIIRGRDIKRYHFVNSDLYLIVTHNGYHSVKNETVHAIDVDKYPAVKNHLNQYIRQLKERQDKGRTIYNLRDCAFMNDFAKEKVIWIELTNQNKFAYSDKEDYLLAGAFFMAGKSLKYLLSFLNSKLCLFYFSLICNSSGMATIQWKKFALEKIPVKELSEKDQKPFIDLVDKILSITKSNDYLTDSAKQAKALEYEKQIDQMVYKLYDLTPEEIVIVEDKNEN